MASSLTLAARRSSCGLSRGWTVNPSGMDTCVSMICFTRSSVIAVGTAAWSTGRSPTSGAATVPGCAGSSAASLVSLKARSSCCWKSRSASSASSIVRSPLAISDSV